MVKYKSPHNPSQTDYPTSKDINYQFQNNTDFGKKNKKISSNKGIQLLRLIRSNIKPGYYVKKKDQTLELVIVNPFSNKHTNNDKIFYVDRTNSIMYSQQILYTNEGRTISFQTDTFETDPNKNIKQKIFINGELEGSFLLRPIKEAYDANPKFIQEYKILYREDNEFYNLNKVHNIITFGISSIINKYYKQKGLKISKDNQMIELIKHTPGMFKDHFKKALIDLLSDKAYIDEYVDEDLASLIPSIKIVPYHGPKEKTSIFNDLNPLENLFENLFNKGEHKIDDQYFEMFANILNNNLTDDSSLAYLFHVASMYGIHYDVESAEEEISNAEKLLEGLIENQLGKFFIGMKENEKLFINSIYNTPKKVELTGVTKKGITYKKDHIDPFKKDFIFKNNLSILEADLEDITNGTTGEIIKKYFKTSLDHKIKKVSNAYKILKEIKLELEEALSPERSYQSANHIINRKIKTSMPDEHRTYHLLMEDTINDIQKIYFEINKNPENILNKMDFLSNLLKLTKIEFESVNDSIKINTLNQMVSQTNDLRNQIKKYISNEEIIIENKYTNENKKIDEQVIDLKNSANGSDQNQKSTIDIKQISSIDVNYISHFSKFYNQSEELWKTSHTEFFNNLYKKKIKIYTNLMILKEDFTRSTRFLINPKKYLKEQGIDSLEQMIFETRKWLQNKGYDIQYTNENYLDLIKQPW